MEDQVKDEVECSTNNSAVWNVEDSPHQNGARKEAYLVYICSTVQTLQLKKKSL